MHPRIEELSDYLATQRAGLRAAIDSVPRERRGITPAPDAWSVDAVVEHLAIIETRITGLLTAKLAEARANGLGAETDASPLLPQLPLDRVLDRTTKIRATEAATPRGGMTADSAWTALQRSRESLHALLRDADGLACREVTQPHPIFGPLDFYTWVAFIGAHETRHANQIRVIGASLGEA